jgi:hypothetical protein
LNLLDPRTGKAARFLHDPGDPRTIGGNNIRVLFHDRMGRLWISSDAGLSCFHPAHETFHNYGEEDGLQSDEFHRGAYFLNRAGEMFFGGYHGFNVFVPEKVWGNRIPAIPRVFYISKPLQENGILAVLKTAGLSP